MSFKFEHDKFAKQMTDQMLTKQLSMRDLADLTKISASTINRVARGKSEPRVSDFVYICNVLDIDIFQFFEEEEYQMRLL